jgi:hypothetical protein
MGLEEGWVGLFHRREIILVQGQMVDLVVVLMLELVKLVEIKG